MSQVKFFASFPSPFCYRVEWALKHKGIDYEYVEEDLANKSPLLLELNPIYQKVPVLLHGDKPISESLVILEYIEETWPQNPLLPEDPYDRAVARFWAKLADEKCISNIVKAFYSEGKEQEQHVEAARESLKILDAHIQGKKFFGGEKIGFTDLVVGWITQWVTVVEEVVEGIKLHLNSHNHPSLHSWCQRFLQEELIKNHLPQREKMIPTLLEVRERFFNVVHKGRAE